MTRDEVTILRAIARAGKPAVLAFCEEADLDPLDAALLLAKALAELRPCGALKCHGGGVRDWQDVTGLCPECRVTSGLLPNGDRA